MGGCGSHCWGSLKFSLDTTHYQQEILTQQHKFYSFSPWHFAEIFPCEENPTCLWSFCFLRHLTHDLFFGQMESSKTHDPWKFTLKFLRLQYWVPYSQSWICGCEFPGNTFNTAGMICRVWGRKSSVTTGVLAFLMAKSTENMSAIEAFVPLCHFSANSLTKKHVILIPKSQPHGRINMEHTRDK